jgi:ribosome biogenesis protein BRX1
MAKSSHGKKKSKNEDKTSKRVAAVQDRHEEDEHVPQDEEKNVNLVVPNEEEVQEASSKQERGRRGKEDDNDIGDDNDDNAKHLLMEAEEDTAFVSDGKYRNKQRCLVLCLRGATARYRHLLEDLRTLLPHNKKESKLDPGRKASMASAVSDIAEMRSCNTVLFLECRKRQDAFMWLGQVGNKKGPSAKFHVTNVHTMDELRLTGNCMKGSRPILTFDESFERLSHLKLLKELFTDVFGTPRGHPKSKPFVDRVMAFYYADKKVCAVPMNFANWFFGICHSP